MKKLLSLIIISLFVMGGLVFADSNYSYENVTILGSNMGSVGKTPAIEAIRVTIGSEDTAVVPGYVMAWGIEPQYTDGNALGLVVNICERSLSEDTSIGAAGKGPYAGVMITSVSNDLAHLWSNANPMQATKSLGIMAIRGYVDAYCDVSLCTQGEPLVIHGNAAIGAGGIAGYFATYDKIKQNSAISGTSRLSQDIGVLLEAAGSADGLRKVWLR